MELYFLYYKEREKKKKRKKTKCTYLSEGGPTGEHNDAILLRLPRTSTETLWLSELSAITSTESGELADTGLKPAEDCSIMGGK